MLELAKKKNIPIENYLFHWWLDSPKLDLPEIFLLSQIFPLNLFFSLLRHFLRELKNNLSDPTKLGAFVVQFINLWIGLNCDILRGGQTTFERCLKRKMKNSHSIKYLSEFVTWSKSQLSPFSIDGYVMSGKNISFI